MIDTAVDDRAVRAKAKIIEGLENNLDSLEQDKIIAKIFRDKTVAVADEKYHKEIKVIEDRMDRVRGEMASVTG